MIPISVKLSQFSLSQTIVDELSAITLVLPLGMIYQELQIAYQPKVLYHSTEIQVKV